MRKVISCKKDIQNLILNEANYNYHVLDNPTITDQEFDKYLRELLIIEQEHPDWIKENSPSQRIGGDVIDEFKKELPMEYAVELNRLLTGEVKCKI